MKFDNLEALVKYIVTENINLKYSDVEFSTNVTEEVVQETLIDDITVKVFIDCLSEAPAVDAVLGTENIIFVESFEAMKNACGTGRLTIMGTTIITNLCEMDDEAHVTLPIKFPDGNRNVEFKIQITTDKNTVLQLNSKSSII